MLPFTVCACYHSCCKACSCCELRITPMSTPCRHLPACPSITVNTGCMQYHIYLYSYIPCYCFYFRLQPPMQCTCCIYIPPHLAVARHQNTDCSFSILLLCVCPHFSLSSHLLQTCNHAISRVAVVRFGPVWGQNLNLSRREPRFRSGLGSSEL